LLILLNQVPGGTITEDGIWQALKEIPVKNFTIASVSLFSPVQRKRLKNLKKPKRNQIQDEWTLLDERIEKSITVLLTSILRQYEGIEFIIQSFSHGLPNE
jgi:hypothetical protein